MSKKEDLTLLFDFLIDYLKGESNIETPVDKKEDSETKPDVNIKLEEKKDEIVDNKEEKSGLAKSFDKTSILMKKLSDMDKAKQDAFILNQKDKDIKNDLDRSLRQARLEHNLKLAEETIEEEKNLDEMLSNVPPADNYKDRKKLDLSTLRKILNNQE